jgi:hypothetical protein
VAGVSGLDGWNFGFEVPEDWVFGDLALTEDERAAALADAVERLVEAEPAFRDDAVRMTNAAISIVADAVARQALAVAVGFALVDGSVAPMAVVAHHLPGTAPVDVDRLAESLRRPHPRDLNGRDVMVVDLPGGPAVRVHAISEGGSASGAPSPVVEGVDYFIPVPGSDDLFLLSCTTPAVAIGDLLQPVFDEMAASVGIDVA